MLERIEANREVGPHTDEIRDSVADLTRRIRDHHAREADLVFGTIGLVLEDDPDPIFPAET